METLSVVLALCKRNPPVTGGFPSQRPVTWGFIFSLICAWTNRWANNRDAGDLRHHCAHYGITVMSPSGPCLNIMTVFPGMGIYIIKKKWSWDCLIFIMGIPTLVRGYLYIEMASKRHLHHEAWTKWTPFFMWHFNAISWNDLVCIQLTSQHSSR